MANMIQNTLGQKIFRDCSTFLLAYGFANGQKDAGVDIIHLPSSEDEQRPWQISRPARAPAANKKILDVVRSYIHTA